MSQLNDAKMQDCLRWWSQGKDAPVWQRSLRSTQGWPVMGAAAKTRSWIGYGISDGNADESQTPRGRETALTAPDSHL